MKSDKFDDFIWSKELIKSKKEYLELEHKLKMERLAFERESNRIFHEHEMERQRIKTAEIRKNFERKQNYDFVNKTAY